MLIYLFFIYLINIKNKKKFKWIKKKNPLKVL